MEFKEIINAIRQYPWQVTVAVISLIPLYIIDLKFLAKRKVGLSRKIEIAKERGHVTKGMIIKKDAKRITVNRSNSDHNYWAARYTYTVAGKEYCRKFSCSPLSSTRSHLRTIINVYWINDPARPFWDYSEDPLGDLYNIFTTLFPWIVAILLILFLPGCSCAKFLSQLLIIFDTNFRKIFSEFNTRNGGIFALRFFDI